MTTHPTLVLLPGLDGTGDLFGPLLKVIPESTTRRVLSYSSDRRLSYAELETVITESLEDAGEVVLVAESFSGPLAVRYAAAHPERVRAVVLCASFIRSPAPRWLRWFARPVLFRLPMPNFIMKRLMLGSDAPESLVRSVKAAVRKVSPDVLAARVRDVLQVDASEALRRCRAPMLYLAANQDVIVNRKSWKTIQAIRPDVGVSVVNAPHLLLQRAPEAAWKEIAMFLKASTSDEPAC